MSKTGVGNPALEVIQGHTKLKASDTRSEKGIAIPSPREEVLVQGTSINQRGDQEALFPKSAKENVLGKEGVHEHNGRQCPFLSC